MNATTLLISIYLFMGLLMFVAGAVIIYFMMWPHKCKIRVQRQDKESIIETRFRLGVTKEGQKFIQTLKRRFKFEQPKEQFFSARSKRSLYVEIVIPDNGEPYCIKPNFDIINKAIKYDLQDRNVRMWKVLEDRKAIQRMTHKTDMGQLLQVGIPLLLILAMLMFSFFQWKVGQNLVEQQKVVSGKLDDVGEKTTGLDNTLKKITGSVIGGFDNPIDSGGTP